MESIKKLIFCWLFDEPIPTGRLIEGRYKGRGDYGDRWARCGRCGGLIHRDAHIFGDNIWRHEKDD